eukprot:gb/GECG01004826.1/.p1 GENE.gb/GECG01004826.1/~~gb/GECG01004826.1/.p1  ORF type:complete len:506 (+),score=103.17 gb/GECG01004826.1/:1-1518(+)
MSEEPDESPVQPGNRRPGRRLRTTQAQSASHADTEARGDDQGQSTASSAADGAAAGGSERGPSSVSSSSGRLGSLLRGVGAEESAINMGSTRSGGASLSAREPPPATSSASSTTSLPSGATSAAVVGSGKPKFAPRKKAHQPRKGVAKQQEVSASATQTASAEEPDAEAQVSTNQSAVKEASTEKGKRRLQKRSEKLKKAGSSQSGRVAFSGNMEAKLSSAGSKAAARTRQSSSERKTGDDPQSTRQRADDTSQGKTGVAFAAGEGQEIVSSENEQSAEEGTGEIEDDEYEAEAGRWPPKFSDPEGPNTLPMETVEGDMFLDNKKSSSREEERKLSLAEKETAEALLSQELAERAGLIGLGLSSDAHAVENAAAALCGSDFADISTSTASRTVTNEELMFFQLPSRLPFDNQTKIANEFVGHPQDSLADSAGEDPTLVKTEEGESAENLLPQDVKDSQELAQKRLDPYHITESMKALPEGRVGRVSVVSTFAIATQRDRPFSCTV